MKQQYEINVTDVNTGGIQESHTRDSKYAAKILKQKLQVKYQGKPNYQISFKPLK